jgi:hypothetical protein
MESSDTSNTNFFKYVFNFDSDTKSEILNIIQYALISIIPIVLLIKTMSKYVPEADDQKSSLELTAEIITQIIVLFIGLFFINRIITFVPTYSGAKYPDISVVRNILIALFITLSLQTKLGEKVNILVERIVDLWEGKTSNNKNGKNKKQKGQAQTQGQSQAQTQILPQTPNQTAMNQSLYSDGTSISSLPSSGASASTPNYNNMYRNDSTPLVGAASPGGNSEQFESFEPMAANSVLGGGAFGSW